MTVRLLAAMLMFLANAAVAQDAVSPLADKAGLFEGTIGKAKVLVLIDGDGSRYSYPKAAADIGLTLKDAGATVQFTETLFVGASQEDLAGERKDTITGEWDVSFKGDAVSGKWTSAKTGKSAPIALTRVTGDSADGDAEVRIKQYGEMWLKNVDLNVADTDIKPSQFGSVQVGWVKDSVFGATYPTLLAYPDTGKMAAINTFLSDQHRKAVLDVRECQAGLAFMADAATLNKGEPKDPEYQYALTYATPTVLSMVESGSVFCGGAHPANYVRPILFDLGALADISSNYCGDEGDCAQMNKSGLGTLIALKTPEQRRAFNTLWWDRWNAAAKVVAAKGGEDGDLATECMEGFENEKPLAERTASFSLTPEGLAVTRTDFSSAAAVCNFQDGYNPIVISWADIKPYLAVGQTLLVDEIK